MADTPKEGLLMTEKKKPHRPNAECKLSRPSSQYASLQGRKLGRLAVAAGSRFMASAYMDVREQAAGGGAAWSSGLCLKPIEVAACKFPMDANNNAQPILDSKASNQASKKEGCCHTGLDESRPRPLLSS